MVIIIEIFNKVTNVAKLLASGASFKEQLSDIYKNMLINTIHNS